MGRRAEVRHLDLGTAENGATAVGALADGGLMLMAAMQVEPAP